MVNVDFVRRVFEELAKTESPEGLSRGRHPTFGTYRHSGLEKRWKGFLAHAHVVDSEIQAYRDELERLLSGYVMPSEESRIRSLLERFQ